MQIQNAKTLILLEVEKVFQVVKHFFGIFEVFINLKSSGLLYYSCVFESLNL